MAFVSVTENTRLGSAGQSSNLNSSVLICPLQTLHQSIVLLKNMFNENIPHFYINCTIQGWHCRGRKISLIVDVQQSNRPTVQQVSNVHSVVISLSPPRSSPFPTLYTKQRFWFRNNSQAIVAF